MRVLVTGATGFVGKRTVPELLARGHEVVALARSDAAAAAATALGADITRGDLDDSDDLASAFREAQADALMNIASLGFGHAPAIVSACHAADIRRAVFVSTTAIFTRLNAPSKTVRLAAERMIQDSGLAFTIVRPTMIYGGPDDRNIARLVARLERTPVMPMPGGGKRLQQPIHVEDLADVLCSALRTPEAIGKCYDVAGPDPISFSSMVRECAHALGRKARLVSVPVGPIIAAARANEHFLHLPFLKAEQFERLAEDKSFDIRPAVADLRFAPRSFAVGIRDELEAIAFARAQRS